MKGNAALTTIATAAALLFGLLSTDQALALPRLSAEPDPVDGGRIVDSRGREVILRGVNVNSLGEYWQGTDVKPVLPFQRRDPGRISRVGWNVVRLIVSWSRVEPRPGHYDKRYLDTVSSWVKRLNQQGVYTIIDLHQDAWGSTLAARTGESCPAGYKPAFGWDGAPGWATLSDDQPRCYASAREVNPAVMAAWSNFFADAPAADGVGIQTHYVRMLGHLAERFAGEGAVAGIDVMNEPNAFGAEESAQLGEFYSRALDSIRRGERRGNGFSHLVLFEPSVLWSLIGHGAPPPFDIDPNVVYSPHLYGGSIGGEGPPSEASFETAKAEAAANFGGAPVLTGEWGGDPARATGADGDYFLAHQALQDEFGIGATLWTWKQSCGDPHTATSDGGEPALPPWNLYKMDCSNGRNRIVGPHRHLLHDVKRGYVRRAPGRLDATDYDPGSKRLTASGSGAAPTDGRLEVYYPVNRLVIKTSGLSRTRFEPLGSGGLFTAKASANDWSLRITSNR